MGNVRTASDQEFWTAIQRLWTFEEPQSRWVRLRKNLMKIAPGSNLNTDAGKSLRNDELVFRQAYGTNSERVFLPNLFYSLNMALAEIERYKESAFGFCISSTDSSIDAGDSRKILQETFFKAVDLSLSKVDLFQNLFDWIVDLRNLHLSQIGYLTHCLIAAPDWSRLGGFGPWSGDIRVDFVTTVLNDLRAACSEEELAGITYGDLQKLFLRSEQCFKKAESNLRSELPSGFLPKRILLVEGATEQILLPHFAECISTGWNERAVLVIPAGGANQVVKRYPALRQMITLPVDCVLDGDVLSQAELISAQLKNGDRLYVLESGAIEEAFPRGQIVDLVNAYFDRSEVGAIYAPITSMELTSSTNEESMEKLWRKRNRGSFDKIGFARVVADSITDARQIPGEIHDLIVRICSY